MKILPSIDILDGKCVRLIKGEFNTKKIYSSDFFGVAKRFEEQGAKMLHIVDLDAAKIGKPINQKLILEIAKTLSIPIEVGGGIRDIETARLYLNNGIQKIVIGTRALNDLEFIASLIQEFGIDRIIIAVEIRNDKVTINGWQENSLKNYLDFVKELSLLGINQILFTDVNKDGTLTEPNFGAIKELIDLGFRVIASGGISNLETIVKLKNLGASSIILGKALYENKIVLKDALREVVLASNLTKRIIPCLDVKEGKVVKGINFKNHIEIGDIVELAKRYSDEGADELVFYDITASTEDRIVSIDWVKKVAKVINIPFCVAGGITSVEDARIILQSGADKISINSPALENPDLINNLVKEFGSQCVVVGIDSFKERDDYFVKQYTGNPEKTKPTKWRTLDWVLEVQKRGAGEVVINCMNQDGTRNGYDISQLNIMSKLLTIPIVASGGAGSAEDFIKVFKKTNIDAALAANVFHSGTLLIPELKKVLQREKIMIRL